MYIMNFQNYEWNALGIANNLSFIVKEAIEIFFILF